MITFRKHLVLTHFYMHQNWQMGNTVITIIIIIIIITIIIIIIIIIPIPILISIPILILIVILILIIIIIGRSWAKYCDSSMPSRPIIWQSQKLRQIIDLRDTDKSHYFA